MEEVDAEISEMKLFLNGRARFVAEGYLAQVFHICDWYADWLVYIAYTVLKSGFSLLVINLWLFLGGSVVESTECNIVPLWPISTIRMPSLLALLPIIPVVQATRPVNLSEGRCFSHQTTLWIVLRWTVRLGPQKSDTQKLCSRNSNAEAFVEYQTICLLHEYHSYSLTPVQMVERWRHENRMSFLVQHDSQGILY